MGKSKISGILLVLMIVGGIFAVEAMQKGSLVKITDRSTVCMLKNRTLGRPFIPVKLEGKTYYGCCEDCTGALQKDRKERFAIDPVTGRQVDKATAVIGAQANGEVLYFENEKNLQTFAR